MEAEFNCRWKGGCQIQSLFPNPSWLVMKNIWSPKFHSSFSSEDNCLMVTKQDFLKMEASLV